MCAVPGDWILAFAREILLILHWRSHAVVAKPDIDGRRTLADLEGSVTTFHHRPMVFDGRYPRLPQTASQGGVPLQTAPVRREAFLTPFAGARRT
jgi:hypothetical protein